MYTQEQKSTQMCIYTYLGSKLICFPDFQCFLKDGTPLVNLSGIHHLHSRASDEPWSHRGLQKMTLHLSIRVDPGGDLPVQDQLG